MGRQPRTHAPGTIHHIIVRGNRRQIIFEDAEDYRRFFVSVLQLGLENKVELLTVTLMPNHAHIILLEKETPLGELLAPLLTSHALYMNRKHGRTGHLFQGRYTDIICRDEAGLKHLVRYIHRNPVRAGLCARPEDWPWSSHNAFLGDVELKGLNPEFVLRLFSEDPTAAKSLYARFMEEESPPQRDDSESEPLARLASNLERESGFEKGVIKGPKKTAPIAELRRKFIQRALQKGHRVTEVAGYLGRTRAAVYEAARKPP